MPKGFSHLSETHTNSSITKWDVVGIIMQVEMAMWIQEKKKTSLRTEAIKEGFMQEVAFKLGPEGWVIF